MRAVADNNADKNADTNPVKHAGAVTYTERVHNPDRVAKPLALGYIDIDADGNAKFVALPGTYYVRSITDNFGTFTVEFCAESAYADYFNGILELLTDPRKDGE